jgi:hypothetical protein
VLGNSAEPWDDVHFYTWQSGLTPQQSEFFYMIHATIDQGNAADDAATELPDRWALGLNYPNPFNPITEIRYSVPRSEPMTLKVYNVMGQEVATLANGIQNPGMHIATFDGSKLASGVYVYRLEAPGFTASQKMLLMK